MALFRCGIFLFNELKRKCAVGSVLKPVISNFQRYVVQPAGDRSCFPSVLQYLMAELSNKLKSISASRVMSDISLSEDTNVEADVYSFHS